MTTLPLKKWVRPYFSPRVFSMLVLGIPYGMMYFLAIPTLQVWLKELGLTNTFVGFFGWACLPYVLKFLWAPLIGYIHIPFLHRRLGSRRSWLVTAHLFLMLFLFLLGQVNPLEDIYLTAVLALCITFFAGIQDIVVDAYRIEILTKEQAGPGIGMLITGYRIGSVTASAGALYIADHWGWSLSYSIMASLVSMGVVAALLNPEPSLPLHHGKQFFKDHVLMPFRDFVSRKGWHYIAAFILLFRFADAVINNMANVFYLEIGFSKTEIAEVTKMFGFFPTLLGGLLGGALATRFGVYRLLFLGASSHALSHLLFVVQASLGYDKIFLYFVICSENITGSLTTAVFLVYLSRLCNLKYTATQYALFTSIWSGASFLAGISGYVSDLLHNWQMFFLLSFTLALPGLFLLRKIRHLPFANQGAYRK